MDLQQVPPGGWCHWCGREIYPGQEFWRVDGWALHEECVGDYARANWPREVMGQAG